jgi:hypothetical protein
MDILATRAFGYTDKSGNSGEVVLTIQMPYPTEHNGAPIWKGDYVFGPPIAKGHHAVGVDFIQVFLCALQIARSYLMAHYPDGRVLWQGRIDCGLPFSTNAQPSHAEQIADEEPIEGSLQRIATRELGYRDEQGTTQTATLSIFAPISDDGQAWKCGIAIDHTENAPLRYGRGADAIEAILDALAIARLVFSSMVANGSLLDEGDLLDCEDFPQKVGRAFWLHRAGKSE